MSIKIIMEKGALILHEDVAWGLGSFSARGGKTCACSSRIVLALGPSKQFYKSCVLLICVFRVHLLIWGAMERLKTLYKPLVYSLAQSF